MQWNRIQRADGHPRALDLTEKIREMILERKAASEIKRAAREDGMTFLRHSALDRIRQGITTLREANKVTFIEG